MVSVKDLIEQIKTKDYEITSLKEQVYLLSQTETGVVVSTFTDTIQEMVDTIKKKKSKITDLRDKIGNLAQSMKDVYLQFANLLAVEIGKTHKLSPEELRISILINGNIIIASGKNDSFKLEFENYNKLLEYLLCMVRLSSLEDGYAVASGKKTQAEVYFKIEQQYGSFCVSCGGKIPPSSEDDDPSIKVCEKCYHDGET